MTQDELTLVLDALKWCHGGEPCGTAEAIAVVEKALAQERKPLTDEQIMANDVLRYHFALNGGAGPISKQGRKVIDAIEAAHGIKE